MGGVEVNIEGNTVDGRGPVAHIARNGIQVSHGARGRVMGNPLSGNACTGLEEDTTGVGILVVGCSLYKQPLIAGLLWPWREGPQAAWC